MYGILDVGINNVSNVGGSSKIDMGSGDLQQSRFGVRGVEDLGGGYKTSFSLESAIDASTGALALPTVLWSREASLSLTTPGGTLSLGRQAPSHVDILAAYTAPMLVYGPGYYSTHPGNFDRSLNMTVDNSVKYMSPKVGGFQFGVTRDFSDSSSPTLVSVGVGYSQGPVSVGAGYVKAKGPAAASIFLAPAANPFTTARPNDLTETYGVGAGYTIGASYLHALATQVRFSGADRKAYAYEVGMKWVPSTPWTLGGDFSHTKVSNSDARMNILSLSATYAFSKRTDIYTIVAKEQVFGSNVAGTPLVAQIFLQGASSSNSQNTIRLAVRHKF